MHYSAAEDFRRDFRVPTWSTLRTLGESRLLWFTILIPFLGTLILFNQGLVDLLLLSPAVVGKWIGRADQSLEVAQAFTLSRLQWTYFGLVFLGIGSGLFAVACPPYLKKFATVSEFIEHERPLVTQARRELLVTDVVTDYLHNHGDEEAWGPKYLRSMAYPPEQEALFSTVISEIFERLPAEEQPNEQPEPDDDSTNFITMIGYVNTEKVARALYQRRRVLRCFWSTFYEAAADHTVDLLAIRYQALDHAKPSFRIAITASYVLGFTILLFPTISTFCLILRRLIGL